MSSRIITLLTDFGTRDAYVGVMKGVILGINPSAQLVDLTHEIPAQDVVAAALTLRNAVRFFPDGSIHLVVVDPGVGSSRQALLVETAHSFLVGPDNGVLSAAAATLGQRSVRVIDNPALCRQPMSQTFHGRDVFAPAVAHLSCGVALETFGPPVARIVDLTIPTARRAPAMIAGEVVYIDHFGNLVTNIDATELSTFPAQTLSVSINGKPVIGPVTAYAAVAEGSPLAIVGSWDVLEIAVRNGDAAKLLDVRLGTPVTVICRET